MLQPLASNLQEVATFLLAPQVALKRIEHFFLSKSVPQTHGLEMARADFFAARTAHGPEAFSCNVPSTSRTLLYSDKAWVYKRHFVLDCNDCSTAQWLGAQRGEESAALV